MDPAQKSTQDPQNQPQQVPQPVTVPSDDISPIPQAPVQAPVGSAYKEHGPLPSAQPKTDAYMQPSGAEMTPDVSPEVAEHGVEVTPTDAPELTQDHKNIGITHAKEHVPVATHPSGAVQFPTAQQAQQILKLHKKVSNSLVWLANIILKQAKIMHKKIITAKEAA